MGEIRRREVFLEDLITINQLIEAEATIMAESLKDK